MNEQSADAKLYYGKQMMKFYPKWTDFLLLAICIACLAVVIIFHRDMVNGAGKQIAVLCIGVALFGLAIVKKVYAVIHSLILYEDGFEHFSLSGRKTYKYSECEFSGRYWRDWLEITGSYAPTVGNNHLTPLYKLVFTISVTAGEDEFEVSGLYFYKFEEKLIEFEKMRKEAKLDKITCTVTSLNTDE